MANYVKGLWHFFKAILSLLIVLPTILSKLPEFLRGLWIALRRCFRRPPRGGCCLKLPSSVHLRPDPMIYDQYYLMAQGLAVTWDNPDIQLFDSQGNLVTSDDVAADQDYQVIVRVWNNSYGAPAAGLLVQLSFLTFGIGISSTPIGGATTNLGVKASARCPAFATFVWHTPSIPGHYCLQATLIWTNDANPANNLGQKNLQVRAMHSPAAFTVPVHNEANVPRRFELEPDMYQLPSLPPCTDRPLPRSPTINAVAAVARTGRYAESRARWDETLRTQAYGMFPVTAEWTIAITPREFDLAPGATINVSVAIEHSGPFKGTKSLNIHGFALAPAGPRVLVGGVTLNVRRS